MLYDFVANMKNYCSIDRLLKNDNVLKVGTGKFPPVPLYSNIKKMKIFSTKKCKNNKKEICF